MIAPMKKIEVQTLLVAVAMFAGIYQTSAQTSFVFSTNYSVAPAGSNTYLNTPYAVAAFTNVDGRVDLVTANYDFNTLTVLTNDGTGNFGSNATYNVGIGPGSVAAADVNGDGYVDLVCANLGTNTLTVLTNDGTGNFVLASSPAISSNPFSVVAADVNGDGYVDLICGSGNFNGMIVLTNDGTGNFGSNATYAVSDIVQSVTTADVNGDGHVDLIRANEDLSSLSVFTNNGSGVFTLSSSPGVGSNPVSVCAADVNGDGKVDLITANYHGGLTVLTNNGSGGFVLETNITVGSNPVFVTAVDVSGDGKMDLICANQGGGANSSLTVLVNNGSGGFVLNTNIPMGNGGANWIAAADFNGDGKVDFACANRRSNSVSVFFNTSLYQVPGPTNIIVTPTNSILVLGSNQQFTATGFYADGSTQILTNGNGTYYLPWSSSGTNVASINANGIATGLTNGITTITASESRASGNATLTVVSAPAITTQPTNNVILLNSNVTFRVSAIGGFLNYQWQFNGTNLADGGNLSGSATTNLVLTPVAATNAGSYDVVITNAWGSVTSSVVTLTVLLPPSITSQPVSQSIVYGQNAVFTMTATGPGPLTYQWLFNATNLPNGIITTVAGTNGSGFSGDGGAATNAKLSSPHGVALDAYGDLFIADYGNNRIREVNTNGIIMTVAGTNSFGLSGDGGAATNAKLSSPFGVAVDAYGNLFIADSVNNRIREVNTNGIIMTVAGTNNDGFSGDGGMATNASLSSPDGLAVDAYGNLFISDSGNVRIREVTTNGIIMTVAGTSSGGFSGDGGAATNATLSSPQGVAVDAYGDLFIADSGNNRIRKINTNGIIMTVAGTNSAGFSGDGGAATNAKLFSPYGVAADAYGNLFVADRINSRIRKVNTNGIITTVAGTNSSGFSGDGGAATNAKLSSPYGVAVDAYGNLFIADTGNARIRKVAIQGPILPVVNVTAANAGNYQAIITGAYGSVTSSVVALTVVLPPITPTFTSSNGTFNLTWGAVSNLTYQLQYNLDLTTTNWVNLGSPITATNGSISTADIIGSDTQRFYRVLLSP
jgi:sugar lactone lactonase YvrE